MEDLEKLRFYTLCLMQALLGVVSPNFRRVSLSLEGDRVLITVVLEHDDADDQEEIDDLQTEFEALCPGPVDYEVDIQVSAGDLESLDDKTVVVFMRRE